MGEAGKVLTREHEHSLIAREHELDRALHSLQFRSGVVVAGEAGVGKTFLAAELARRLPTPPVASIVATAASRTIPLGALAGLLPPDLATIHPALVAQHVSTRLRELSRTERRSNVAPVLVVDDAQLLDAQSAAVLLSLVSARSLRLLATIRVGEDPSDAVTALWKDGLVDRLDLLPLDRAATRRLLAGLLGGPVATAAVETLWNSSHGNPLYLTELARYGADHGQLELRSGVWWWTGGAQMPPRLGELLRRRLEAVSAPGRDAAELLAMGEPLPYETLAAVAGEDAILELDRRQIITSSEHDGTVLLRFAHPLLHAVAEQQLSPARRRALARRLRAAPAEHVDIVRRATWEDIAGGSPNVDLLLAAADAVLMNDAEAAVRLATRARQIDPGIRAVVMLAAAQSEAGRPTEARATLETVRDRAAPPRDRLKFAAEDISIALWGERDPQAAWAAVRRLGEDLPAAEFRNYHRGAEAMVRLFTGECTRVIPIAEQILDDDPDPSSRIRALTCLTGALAFADRGAEAIAAGQQLLDALAGTRVSATRAGLAYALVATTGLFYGVEYRLPRSVGTSGRWPGEPEQLRTTSAASAAPAGDGAGDLGWPLLVGIRRHFAGDLEGALAPLREAYVQQQSGEGLFRSESTGELVVVLAELGRVDEAGQIMAGHPPDQVSIVPGIALWAHSAFQAATGQSRQATATAIEAAQIAARHGAAGMAMNFLTDAGRYGDARAAAAALPSLGLALDTPVQQVRAADITARASRNADQLLAAAEAQLAAGFNRHARELAELAAAVDRRGSHERAVAGVLRRVREQLGEAAGSGGGATSPLTHRETEVARLAKQGLSDREIADELVLSIRTVQSHLASVYRKLGITSRAELG